MSEEKIFTQEEFNTKLGELLSKKTKKYEDEAKTLQGEIDDLNNQIKDLNEKQSNFDAEKASSTKEIEDLKLKIKGYETASEKRKIAESLGLDKEAVEFIQGDTEEEMKASAEKLKGIVGSTPFVPPLAQNDDKNLNSIDAALKKMNDDLKGAD